jgi:phage/plasmid-like protein (TIGR03299 family)
MAHQIETFGGQATAIYARTDPWHRLGTTVQGRAFTADEAMTLGHLGGWQVRKIPLTATEPTRDGVTTIPVPGYATVRDNPFTGLPEALGVVGDLYTPMQNEDHATFLNTLADESGAIFDTAGSLNGGRQVFITMRLPDTMKVGGTDLVDVNIAALNSHDGSSPFRILVTPIRVVCANTQAAAIRDHLSSFAVRHTRNAKATLQQARDAIGLTFAYHAAFEAEAERLIQTTMTDATFDHLISTVFGQPDSDATARTQTAERKRRDRLHHLFGDADTQAGIRGTAWAGYQAVAEYIDHFAPVQARRNADVARATRLLTSDQPARLKRTAWAALATTQG